MCVVKAVNVWDDFFFFQAEDGIRDGHVTGVQTCALPIFGRLGEEALIEVADSVGVAAFETRRVVSGEIGDGGEGNERDARYRDAIEAWNGEHLGAGDRPQPSR